METTPVGAEATAMDTVMVMDTSVTVVMVNMAHTESMVLMDIIRMWKKEHRIKTDESLRIKEAL